MRPLFLALSLCVLLVACGGDEPTSTTEDGNGPGSPDQPGTGPGTAEPAVQPDTPPPPPPPPSPEEIQKRLLLKIERKMRSSDVEDRLEAVDSLTKLEDKGVAGPLVEKFLKDESEDVRETAVRTIHEMEYMDGVEDLRLMLRREESPLIRKVIVQSLHDMIGDRVATDLIDLIGKEPEGTVKAMAITLLAETGHPRAGPVLLAALEDFNNDVRRNALVAMQKVKPSGAAEMVLGLLDDMSTEVRLEAARTLGFLGDKKAVPRLMVYLDEEDESDQGIQHATNSLAMLTGRANDYDVNADEEKRSASLKAWKDWWEANKGKY